jgi:tetratricopeptide (TPR) repeat protein
MPTDEFTQSLRQYQDCLEHLEQSPVSHLQPVEILDLLLARDRVEKMLETIGKPGVAQSAAWVIALESLDQRFKAQKHKLIWYRWQHSLKFLAPLQTDRWWWRLIQPPHPWDALQTTWVYSQRWAGLRDRLHPYLQQCRRWSQPLRHSFVWVFTVCDPLWKVISVGFIIGSLSLAGNIAPRLLAGGPSAEGVFAIIAPSVISLFLGKETLEQLQQGQGAIERFLEKLWIPQILRQEFAAILSAALFFGLLNLQNQFPTFAQCYYRQGLQRVPELPQQAPLGADSSPDSLSLGPLAAHPDEVKPCLMQSLLPNWVLGAFPSWLIQPTPTPPNARPGEPIASSKLMVSAEGEFKRAIAFNPDYGEAHFGLGWLSEQRQDMAIARSEYKLAMQNGSRIARIRLAGLYLRDGNKESANAAAAILWQGRNEILDERNTNQAEKKSWYTAIGWVRLQQERYVEAIESLNQAAEIHQQMANEGDRQSAAFYCLTAEVLDRQKKPKEAQPWWHDCEANARPTDPDEDLWLGKAIQKNSP